MNGFELERILSLIEANTALNQPLIRTEVLAYVQAHEDEVLEELRAGRVATIRTSVGPIAFRVADLEAALA
jgi:hypothetical protein